MNDTIDLGEFVAIEVKEALVRNPKAKIAVMGPSTLDRDHSTLFLSDILSETDAELIVVDMPTGRQRVSYGSLRTLQRQMAAFQKNYHRLKKPMYVEQDIFALTKKLRPESIDIIFDHNSLGWIVVERPARMDYTEAVSAILKIYKTLITPNGLIILAHDGTPSQQSEGSLGSMLPTALSGRGLACRQYHVRDIDLRNKFPEIIQIIGKYGYPGGHRGLQYPCETMLVCTKPK